eukprot:SAG31_NODE_6388_length_2036_cov_1.251936_2_plen_75_part_01
MYFVLYCRILWVGLLLILKFAVYIGSYPWLTPLEYLGTCRSTGTEARVLNLVSQLMKFSTGTAVHVQDRSLRRRD